MPLYEHVFIARQDISTAQAETLGDHFAKIVSDNDGSVVDREYWGLRTLAYRINRNRKGHYMLLKLDAPAQAVAELERLMRIHEDILRYLTTKVEEHEQGPSVVMRKSGGSGRADADSGRERYRSDSRQKADR